MSIWDRIADRAADVVFGPKGQTNKELGEELEQLRKEQEEADKKDGKK